MKSNLLTLLFVALMGLSLNAQVNCEITNIQGGLASGIPSAGGDTGFAFATYFNPAWDGTAGPGCNTTEMYTIDSVYFNIADGAAFGAANNGIFEYTYSIVGIDNTSGCDSISGVDLWTSGILELEVTGVGQNQLWLPVDFDVTGPFFVQLTTVSWAGDDPAGHGPTILWDAEARPTCHQYMNFGDGAGYFDHHNVFASNSDLGWADVKVAGSYLPVGINDIEGSLTISKDNNMFIVRNTNEAVSMNVAIYNVNGQLVSTQAMNLANGGTQTIDLTNEAAGIYMAVFNDGTNSETHKLMVH